MLPSPIKPDQLENGLIDDLVSPLKAQSAFRFRTASTGSLAEGHRRISTISTSQPTIEITPLQPQTPTFKAIPVTQNDTPNGYKHWTARSGTLVANMLVAAGMFFFLWKTCISENGVNLTNRC